MSIFIAVMAHPTRRDAANKLAAELLKQGTAAQVFVDEDSKGCWWNARRCWLAGAASKSDYVLVIQDDVTVADDFLAAVEKILALRPTDVISFFDPRPHIRHVQEVGLHWARTMYFAWAQAVIMPGTRAAEAVAYVDTLDLKDTSSDAMNFNKYFRAHDVPVFVTVPCPVQHDTALPSVLMHMGGIRFSSFVELKAAAKVNWSDLRYIDQT